MNLLKSHTSGDEVLRLFAGVGYKAGIHIDLDSSHQVRTSFLFLYLQIPAQPSDTNPFWDTNFVSGPSADTKSGVL